MTDTTWIREQVAWHRERIDWLVNMERFLKGQTRTVPRSHEPPRNKPGELEQDPQPSARRD